ncbi:hypothetical protein JW930_07830, partial [Candidatus Woesearchaeota archaeon]|nr:hypothetical protein [Candidatus Woesearchaeota archaeon]
LPELPLSARDMVQSLMDAVLIELGRDADNILFIKSNFIVEDKNVEGSLVLFFDQNSLQLMLNKLREIYGINI